MRNRVIKEWTESQPFKEIPKEELIEMYEKFRNFELQNKINIFKELGKKKVSSVQTKLFIESSYRKTGDVFYN